MLSMDLSLLPSLLPHSLATLSNSDLTELPKSRCISNNLVYSRFSTPELESAIQDECGDVLQNLNYNATT